MLLYFLCVFFLIGFYFVFFYHFHYLLVLLGLELSLLSVFFFFYVVGFCFFSYWGSFLFLLVLVCMGGFGISLLVGLSRLVGKDTWGAGSCVFFF